MQTPWDECRWLYNERLSQRKTAYEKSGISLSKYQQLMVLPLWKEERSSLQTVYSPGLQNVGDRLDKAFQSFFRRCKRGEKPGFPRFRGMHRYNSFCYPQSGFTLLDKEIALSKIGRIRLKMHRPIEGVIKTCTIKKTAAGAWDITFSCEVKAVPLEPNRETIAIDVGIESWATFSNGEKMANPRFFKRGEKALAQAQRKFSA